jgi:LPXTG-motif cell wall-anchored protein
VIQRIDVPVDDSGAEALQAGASALGGAGLALGGLWLYRRRHVPAI